MKIKTSKLTDAALDWIVLQLEKGKNKDASEVIWQKGNCSFSPTTNWNQGGPIIEREDISFRKYHNQKSESHGTYYARICRESGTMVGWYKTTGNQQTGPTPLIAAMRCYVASKLGDEVEIPDELI